MPPKIILQILSFLTLFFPLFPFDPYENIRKPNIFYPLIRTRTCAYQGVKNIRFSDVFRGDQKEILRRKWLIMKMLGKKD